MKNIKHHTIVITSNERDKLESLRNTVITMYKEQMEAKKGTQLVSPIMESIINGFCTFYILPDGSKEGYDASEDGDIIRQRIVQLIDKQKVAEGDNPIRYAEICYGTDDGTAEILHHN